MYGSWLVWLLELVFCQLCVSLGMPAAQLWRRSGLIRGAAPRLVCCWRQNSGGGSRTETLLPLVAPPHLDAEAVAESEASPKAAPPQQLPSPQRDGELAEMNLSDALSGGLFLKLCPPCSDGFPPQDDQHHVVRLNSAQSVYS